jgi:ABC-type antimicrobial peptide transport system permease subunit
VRTTAGPQIAAAVRAALRSEDAQLPIQRIRSMEDVVDGSTAQRRFQLTLMAAFALSALLVASLGIYGVVSYSVARRRNEIGIRMALVAALFLSRAIRSLLFEVQPTNFLTIAGVVAVLLVVGMGACFLPGRKAANADAVTALRFE